MNQFDPFEPSGHDSAGPELAERTPNRKLLLIGGIVCAVIAAVLVLVFAFGSTLRAKTAPGKTLKKAYTNTAEAVQKQMKDSPWQMWYNLAEALRNGTLKASFAFDDGWSEGSGDIWLRSNWKEPAFAVGMDITADGMPLDGELYFDRERAVLSSSILPDCYGITFGSFAEDFRASALPEWLDLSEDDVEEIADAFEEVAEQMAALDERSLTDSSNQVLEDFIDGLDFQTSKETQTIGGEDCSCIVLSAQLTEENIKNFAASLMDLYFTPTAAMEDAFGYTGLEETREAMEEIMLTLYKGADLTCYLYHDRLVKITLSNDARLSGEVFHYSLEMDYGKDPGADGWDLAFSMNPIGEEPLVLHLTFVPDSGSAAYSDRLELAMTIEDETIRFALATDWDRETGDLSMTLESLTGELESIRLEGNLTLDDNGRSVLRFDNLGELLSDVESAEITFDLALTAEKDTGPSCPVFINLDEWDEDTLNEIMQAIYDYSEMVG